jgi:hypothetical protein
MRARGLPILQEQDNSSFLVEQRPSGYIRVQCKPTEGTIWQSRRWGKADPTTGRLRGNAAQGIMDVPEHLALADRASMCSADGGFFSNGTSAVAAKRYTPALSSRGRLLQRQYRPCSATTPATTRSAAASPPFAGLSRRVTVCRSRLHYEPRDALFNYDRTMTASTRTV